MPTLFSLAPCSPLAASMLLQSSGIGTMWPPTKPPATSPRRKGHGLLGETAVGGASPGMTRSCMKPNPEKKELSIQVLKGEPNDGTLPWDELECWRDSNRRQLKAENLPARSATPRRTRCPRAI